MRTVYTNGVCQEGLYYASPPLYAELMHWLTRGGPVSDKLLITLYKYFIRMTTRSTPFGVFSGVAVGRWGSETDWRIEPDGRQRMIRLDANYVSQLFGTLNADTTVRTQLTYSVNSTLWAIADTVRYIGYTEQDGRRVYYQNEVAINPHLHLILEQAQNGRLFSTLVQLLVTSGIEPSEATEYIHALIDNQLLVSELGVNLTGPDPLTGLLNRLQTLQTTGPLMGQISQMQIWLQAQTIPAYNQLATALQDLIGAKDPNIVQCDTLFCADRLVLSQSVRDLLSSQLSALTALNNPVASPQLDAFKRRFFERYENQTVPLLLALDPDSGIGYGEAHELPTPWLDDLPWPSSASARTQALPTDALLMLYTDALRHQQTMIRLTRAQLDELTSNRAGALPDSAYALGSVLREADSPDLLFVLKAMSGPSAANLLGRFAAATVDLEDDLRQALQQEQQAYPDAVLAELVYLPESRTGNVLRRPNLRAYEIPILTSSTVPLSNQLPLNDLLISVPNGQRVVLSSKKLAKRVIPRLSTAHHVQAGGLVHYRFLYDLQHQEDSLRVAWDWGLLNTMPFLPRVQYEQVILQRARWFIRQRDWNSVQSVEAQRTWKQQQGLPRFVVLAESDNELVIDTNDPTGWLIIEQTLKKNGQVILFEWLEATAPSMAQSTDGRRWCHEIVIPLCTARSQLLKPLAPPAHRPLNESETPRQFPPGSEWVYVKLYTGAARIDSLLNEKISPLLSQLRQKTLCQSWFFIRYADPEKHLRLRFRAQPGQQRALLDAVSQWTRDLLSEDKRLHRIQYDTYERELERYYPLTIDACEAWFSYDSDTVLTLLAFLHNDPHEWQRLRVACLTVQALLTAWQYDLPAQITIIESWRDSFLKEFEADKPLLTKLNDLFRAYKSFFTIPQVESEPQLVGILTEYERQAGKLYAWLCSLPASPEAITADKLIPHLAHLFINRLFEDSPRKNEVVVYFFLYKLLKQWKAIRSSSTHA